MIRFLLLAILFFLIARAFWSVVDGIMEAAGGSTRQRRAMKPSMKLVKDPVCGTWVPPREQFAMKVGSVTHYFCSDACRAQFRP